MAENENQRRDLEGRRALILGAGRTGVSVMEFLTRRGAIVTISDRRSDEEMSGRAAEYPDGTRTAFGGHSVSLLEEPVDFIVVSPGVDLRQPFVREARRRGVPVLGEIELAYRYCPQPTKIVAVTGTNGKSTTVTMIAECLRQDGKDYFVGGNLGTPFLEGVSEALDADRKYEGYLLEISSFQLESVSRFRPDIGLLLNVMPDHLDRYENLEEYGLTKLRLFAGMSHADDAVVNAEDSFIYYHYHRGLENRFFFSQSSPVTEGVWQSGRAAISNLTGQRYDLSRSRLEGGHNDSNWLASIAVCERLGLSQEAIGRAIESYRGLPHRQQRVEEIDGVRFVNDSKATNVAGTKIALKAIRSPIRLILGGEAKGDDFNELGELLKKKVAKAYVYGRDREEIGAVVEAYVERSCVGALEEAIEEAARDAQPGDTVLLSPACASFDQFSDYAMRGDAFAQKVRMLKEKA